MSSCASSIQLGYGQSSCSKPWTEAHPLAGQTGDLVSNYLLTGGSLNTTYLTQLNVSAGSSQGGDLNAQYTQMYFSLTQLDTLTAAGVCPVELLLFGAFPNVRYFVASVYDMHYSLGQHITDVDMDPISTGSGGSATNPFQPLTPYQQSQYYLVPVGLGTVPSLASTKSGCGITPSEADNLLDGTQRHQSIDWNTDYLYAPYAGSSGAHQVDYPDHSNANTAGVALTRAYLPLYPNCTNQTTCPGPSLPPVYAVLRDASTGCPIDPSTINSTYNILAPSTASASTAASYVFWQKDPSSSSSNWLSTAAEAAHNTYSNFVADSCYADQSQPPTTSPNVVAWTRSPEWIYLPAPDDAYVGGAISTGDLNTLAAGSCPGTTGSSCLILMQFQLPSMPDTPCAAVSGSYPCDLSGSEQLRYMSLSFGFNTGTTSNVLDLDGINANVTSGPTTLVSLADSAFATTSSGGNNYVNLLVNVDPGASSALNSYVSSHTHAAAIEGVNPRTNGTNYSVFQLANGYTVLDLTPFSGFSSWYNSTSSTFGGALQINLRNTLPGNGFSQSGLAVPFSTAQYLGSNTGWMGAYAPIVSYIPVSSLSSPSLPTFPTGGHPTNQPTTNAANITLSPRSLQNYPEQYWPSSGLTGPEELLCGSSSPTTQINFVGTQFSIPVDNAPTFTGSPTNCNLSAANNSCSQIFAQSTQTTANGAQNWQPGLPLTIEGKGFGTLPVMSLPYATTGWGSTSYLTVTDTNSGGTSWTSPNSNCQMYILKWSQNSITVIPNIQANATNGVSVVLSPLTDTNPLSLAASSSCPISATDSIQVSVTNPQSGTSVRLPNPITVGTYVTGSPTN